MVKMIKYPNADNPNVDEWCVMLDDMETFSSGLLAVGVDNINSDGVPRILSDSLVAVSNSRYVLTSDEDILGQAANNAQNYIYAVAAEDGLTASFVYSTVAPQWNHAKGGWYAQFNPGGQISSIPNEDHRAIVKLFVTGGKYNNKVILDSFNAMQMMNTKQQIPASGGVSVYDSASVTTFPKEETLNLEPGMYRYDIKGASGGAGGNGSTQYAYNGVTTQHGKGGFEGERRQGTFIWDGGQIIIQIGQKGGNGAAYNASGTAQYTWNGGGGGEGGLSRLGSFVALGGKLGEGGLYNGEGGYFRAYTEGGDGYHAHGAAAGKGGRGSYKIAHSVSDENLYEFLGKTKGGEPPTNASDGYVKIWRVG